MKHFSRSHEIFKVLNEVLIDDPVEPTKAKAPKDLRPAERVVGSLAHQFGVGNPEEFIKHEFGRGVTPQDLKNIMKDRESAKSWYTKQPEVETPFGTESLDDVVGDLENAKTGTKLAALGLGALASGGAIGALPSTARTAIGLGAGGYAVGKASTLHPVARDAVDYAQQVGDFAGMYPTPWGAWLDFTSAMADVGQDQYNEAGARAASAVLTGVSNFAKPVAPKTVGTLGTAADLAWQNANPIPTQQEKPLFNFKTSWPFVEFIPQGFGDKGKDTGKKNKEKLPAVVPTRDVTVDYSEDDSSSDLVGTSVGSSLYNPNIDRKIHKFMNVKESNMPNNFERNLLIQSTLNECLLESFKLNETLRPIKKILDLFTSNPNLPGRVPDVSTRNVPDARGFDDLADAVPSRGRPPSPTRPPQEGRFKRGAKTTAKYTGSAGAGALMHYLMMRALMGGQGNDAQLYGGGEGGIKSVTHGLYALDPTLVANHLAGRGNMMSPVPMR